jgi:hypothetical protein
MEDKIKELKYIIRNIEEVSTSIFYVGYGLTSMSESSPLWIIKKILINSTITTIKYAQGIWNNRSTLTYI